MLQQPNLLLLDEPTNNLDIPSMEVLERALDEFEGALLVISHDRYFLDQTVDQVIELDDGALQQLSRRLHGLSARFGHSLRNPRGAIWRAYGHTPLRTLCALVPLQEHRSATQRFSFALLF